MFLSQKNNAEKPQFIHVPNYCKLEKAKQWGWKINMPSNEPSTNEIH